MPEQMLKAYGVPVGRGFGRVAALLLTVPKGVMVPSAKALGVLVFDEKRPLPLGRFDVINMACCYCLSLGRTRSTQWLLGKPVPSDRLPGRRLVPTAPWLNIVARVKFGLEDAIVTIWHFQWLPSTWQFANATRVRMHVDRLSDSPIDENWLRQACWSRYHVGSLGKSPRGAGAPPERRPASAFSARRSHA
jgi:hypothetical protein